MRVLNYAIQNGICFQEARMRTSLDCVMGRFLGTLPLFLSTLLLLLGTVLLVLGSLVWLVLVTMLVLLLGGVCLGAI